jgi:hypothetical protein
VNQCAEDGLPSGLSVSPVPAEAAGAKLSGEGARRCGVLAPAPRPREDIAAGERAEEEAAQQRLCQRGVASTKETGPGDAPVKAREVLVGERQGPRWPQRAPRRMWPKPRARATAPTALPHESAPQHCCSIRRSARRFSPDLQLKRKERSSSQA